MSINLSVVNLYRVFIFHLNNNTVLLGLLGIGGTIKIKIENIYAVSVLHSQQLEQASADVEKVLESYEKSGKVPSTVMEAR